MTTSRFDRRRLLMTALLAAAPLQAARPQTQPKAKAPRRPISIGPRQEYMRRAIADMNRAEQEVQRKIEASSKGGSVAFFERKPLVLPFLDWDFYYLDSSLKWAPNAAQTYGAVEVPRGFVTDLASVPPAFWGALPPTGRYAYAAVVHDYLYWEQPVDRAAADDIFRIAMQDLRVPSGTVSTLYEAVRWGGAGSWSDNAAAKARGERRVLAQLPTEPGTSWADWRARPGVFKT